MDLDATVPSDPPRVRPDDAPANNPDGDVALRRLLDTHETGLRRLFGGYVEGAAVDRLVDETFAVARREWDARPVGAADEWLFDIAHARLRHARRAQLRRRLTLRGR